MSYFLTLLLVLQVSAFVLAMGNPECPKWYAWCIMIGGLINTMFLMIFFLYELCMWGMVLSCPVSPVGQ